MPITLVKEARGRKQCYQSTMNIGATGEGGRIHQAELYFNYCQRQATKGREWRWNIQIISPPALSSPASVSHWLNPTRIQKSSSSQGSAFRGTKQGREEKRLQGGQTETNWHNHQNPANSKKKWEKKNYIESPRPIQSFFKSALQRTLLRKSLQFSLKNSWGHFKWLWLSLATYLYSHLLFFFKSIFTTFIAFIQFI